MRILLIVVLLSASGVTQAQITRIDGNLTGMYIDYLLDDVPGEDSETFVKPDSLQLRQWSRILDLYLAGSWQQAKDSLSLHFSNYELLALTDTTFLNTEYYVIKERSPIVYGWGIYAVLPDHQRDAIIGIPHPEFDSYTVQQGVTMFKYLGARVLAMAGTHRCANDESAQSDGTTTACSNTNSSENFKVSDTAHNDSTVFQYIHRSAKGISSNIYAINLHGHNNANCEDVYLSNGRSDDPKPILQTLKDTLVSYQVNTGITGDGSVCPLNGSTNVQGRFINGSTLPDTEAPIANTGFFFHVEQSGSIRRALMNYRPLVQAFGAVIPRVSQSLVLPELPSVVFNEIHAFPAADANNNGIIQTVSDEFVEIVNTGNEVLDLSGWRFDDFSQLRHQIASPTRLIPGQPLLLFGGNTPVGDFGGANVQVASSGSLNLSNSGEPIYLKTAARDTILFVSYPGGFEGQSIVLEPELTGTSYVAHSTADSDDQSVFSPGTKVDGTPFLPFVSVQGDQGWRMLAAPTTGLTVSDLRALTAVQGFGDGFTKNIYSDYNGTIWTAPAQLSDTLQNGKGFILFFYDNNNAGSTELPITLRSPGSAPDSDVNVALHADGNKWNLIGNPFSRAFRFSDLQVSGGSLFSAVGQIYNPSSQSYVTTTSLHDTLAAWQGVMVENNTATSVTFPASSMLEGGSLLRSVASSEYLILIELKDVNSSLSDMLVVYFHEQGDTDWDPYDAVLLPSLSSRAVQLSVPDFREDKTVSLTQWSLPLQHEQPIVRDLTIGSAGDIDSVLIRFKRVPENVPGLQLILTDLSTDDQLTMHSGDEWMLTRVDGEFPEIALSIIPTPAVSNEDTDMVATFEVQQNFPNPFNPSTSIRYSLPSTGDVVFEVFSVSGALVHREIHSARTAGDHLISFNGRHLGSGMYFYRVTTPFGATSKKMILMK